MKTETPDTLTPLSMGQNLVGTVEIDANGHIIVTDKALAARLDATYWRKDRKAKNQRRGVPVHWDRPEPAPPADITDPSEVTTAVTSAVKPPVVNSLCNC